MPEQVDVTARKRLPEGFEPDTAAEAILLDHLRASEAEVGRLRAAMHEAIGWSYGEAVTPERRDEVEAMARGDRTVRSEQHPTERNSR